MGQPRELRRLNRRTITQLLFSNGGLTRPQLADQAGLSKVTVNAVVQELLSHNIVRLSIAPGQGIGRTPHRVELQPQLGAFLAVSLQPTRIHSELSGLSIGAPRARVVECAEPDLTNVLLEVIQGAIADAAYGPLRHVLIGLPAPVDPQGRVREPNVTHHLNVDRVVTFLEAAKVTYGFENDANLVALATTREAPGWSHVAVLIERCSGTGMGLLLGGELYRGMHGRAGEIGRSRWPSPRGAAPLESLPSSERLEATAFMLAGLVHTLDVQHVVLGLAQERASALRDALGTLLDLSITVHLRPDVDHTVLRGAALLARDQAHEHLLTHVEALGGHNTYVA